MRIIYHWLLLGLLGELNEIIHIQPSALYYLASTQHMWIVNMTKKEGLIDIQSQMLISEKVNYKNNTFDRRFFMYIQGQLSNTWVVNIFCQKHSHSITTFPPSSSLRKPIIKLESKLERSKMSISRKLSKYFMILSFLGMIGSN